MIHELKRIFNVHETSAKASIKSVLATVVALDGSSYRKPGVRMLILENGYTVGAVSGGCVEKEIVRQTASVFGSGIPKIMTYDGRYRLGCEGILYILLEPFDPETAAIQSFWENVKGRVAMTIESFYAKQDSVNLNYGSFFVFGKDRFSVHGVEKEEPAFSVFRQTLEPCFQLFIVGAEHDAVQLCSLAAKIGMEVIMVADPREEKSIEHFPGAERLMTATPEDFPTEQIDEYSAVVLMNHSYVKDLHYLLSLRDTRPFYMGLLGPFKRREDLLNAFLDKCPDTADAFLESLHGPAGLDIGAVTPQEIGIAILAEILMVARKRVPLKLRDKQGSIHSDSQ